MGCGVGWVKPPIIGAWGASVRHRFRVEIDRARSPGHWSESRPPRRSGWLKAESARWEEPAGARLFLKRGNVGPHGSFMPIRWDKAGRGKEAEVMAERGSRWAILAVAAGLSAAVAEA